MRRSVFEQVALPSRYQVLGVVAKGGMGIVYRALDRRKHRQVAVKTLASFPGDDLVPYLRFQREAETASALNHPNICQVLEIASFRGTPYIVMELLEGQTAKELRDRGACDPALVLRLAQQIAVGLSAVHDQGTVHRDIKPGNVFITRDGVVKLLDFGIAKHFAVIDTARDSDATVTETGHTPGTVQYMSPEQLRGERLDHRTDLFSLGVMLQELLTGRHPFAGATPFKTYESIQHQKRPPLTGVPFAKQWGFILDQLLAKDPELRYANANALVVDLDRLDQVMQGDASAWRGGTLPAEEASLVTVVILPFRAVEGRGAPPKLPGLVEAVCEELGQRVGVGLMRVEGLRVVTTRSDRILAGEVEWDDNRFLVTLSLFDQRVSRPLWTGRYNSTIVALSQLHSEIVSDVAEEFGLVAPPVVRREVGTHPGGVDEALGLCVIGRRFWARRYKDGLESALKKFKEAEGLAPTLAEAHAGLADTYSFLALYSIVPPQDAFGKALDYATKALQFDCDLAQAHTSLGLIKLGRDWDWNSAIAEFKKAIDLDSGQVLARIYLSWTLVLTGEIAKAHDEAEQVQKITPGTALLYAAAAYTLFLSRSYDEAIRACEMAFEKDAGFLVAKYVMALCKGELAWQAREGADRRKAARLYKEAIALLESVVKGAGDMVFYKALLGKMYAESGQEQQLAKAHGLLKEFEQMRAAKRYVGPHAWVYVYTGLGDLDRAFEWQAKAFDDCASPFNYLSPQLGRLHSDPRFLPSFPRNYDISRWAAWSIKTTS
ncbi:MAG TPA: protein kinase [Vicinamibacterales bacterium]|jgi:tetratricopeptide (TPR) repeat protein